MKLTFATTILLFISTLAHAQCDLTQRFEMPVMHSIQSPLPPDPCGAKADYGTTSELVLSPAAGYQEVKKQIRVVAETIWDADHCNAKTVILSQDTTEVSNKMVSPKGGSYTGGYWTIRMELLVMPPVSRPEGTVCTKLPKGALTQRYRDGSTQELKDYWVVHNGKYNNVEDAKEATEEFKQEHPEFCRAYPYFLPANCEWEYSYKANTNNLNQ